MIANKRDFFPYPLGIVRRPEEIEKDFLVQKPAG